MSVDKDKYLIPAWLLGQTKAPNSSHYHRYPTYTDALKKLFFPGLFCCKCPNSRKVQGTHLDFWIRCMRFRMPLTSCK